MEQEPTAVEAVHDRNATDARARVKHMTRPRCADVFTMWRVKADPHRVELQRSSNAPRERPAVAGTLNGVVRHSSEA